MQGLLNQAGGAAQEPMPEEQLPADAEGGDDFQDPALQRAISYVGDRLYGPDKL